MTTAMAMITAADLRPHEIAMAEYDCWATAAHVLTLRRAAIITAADATLIIAAIHDIERISARGEFPYDPSLGSQLTLEKLIVDRVGNDAGYRVHTGRSRNDQVLTAQKLYVRDGVLEVFGDLVKLAEALVGMSAATAGVVMPGYTHMQPARPTTFGQWCAANADMLLRDSRRLRDTYGRHNTCPLGAAESYGTSWPLDREYTAEVLAFDGVDEIPIDAVSSRGESDADFLSALAFSALHLSRMAEDLLLMNTFEYGMVELGEATAERMGALTGSSIMPQKKNPDILELIRANASAVYADLLHCLELLKALPMGYNRDSRDTKGPIIDGMRRTRESLSQMTGLIQGLVLRQDRMRQLVDDNYSLATDAAEYLAQISGVPYRIMYRIVGAVVKQAIAEGLRLNQMAIPAFAGAAAALDCSWTANDADLRTALDPMAALERRRTLGGAARERMAEWAGTRTRRIEELEQWRSAEVARIAGARAATWDAAAPQVAAAAE